MGKLIAILIIMFFMYLDCKTFLMENIKNGKFRVLDFISITLELIVIFLISIQ